MIKRIIHIADIHIPNSENERPYSKMLEKSAIEIVKACKGFKQEEVRIVLVGDIFHQKIKATNEAKTMFHNYLNMLNKIARTYIIAGNHDMLENNQDRMDSINPTFEIKGVYPNIIYADRELGFKSGYIEDENVIFALYSMHDNFMKPNIEGLKGEKIIDENTRIIGLYHGDIAGSVTDSGRISEKGIDTDVFKECDCVMAGHIHKFQEIKKNGVPIVYSGSLFQQDCGENTTGHGFVVWDLDTMKYHHVDVENDYKTYKFNINSYEDVTNDIEKLVNL